MKIFAPLRISINTLNAFSMKIKGTINAVVNSILLCIMFIGCRENKARLQQFTTPENIKVLVEYTDQGAYGSHVTLSLSGDSTKETFILRSEDAIPSIDSIVNKTIYIHYEGFPSKDSILNPQLVLLGESLFKTKTQFSLKIANKR